VNAKGAEIAEFGRPGAAAGVEFLMRTLELAQTMLRAASDSRNPEHVIFCRRAARDFLSSVTRLLPHIEPAEWGRGEVVVAAERLESQLRQVRS
jgi:hypothetical protein